MKAGKKLTRAREPSSNDYVSIGTHPDVFATTHDGVLGVFAARLVARQSEHQVARRRILGQEERLFDALFLVNELLTRVVDV